MIPKLNDYKRSWNVESANEIKPGLDAMKQALQMIGHPEENLSIVHIAGTNGKGSTITFLEQIARSHGLTVAKFMSPCIVDFHDQIQFNGKPIEEVDVNEIFQQLKTVSGMLTDFELLTCVAFLYFQKTKPDLVLLEVGMGGKDDSTNVITPIASVIPSIALDHTTFLGSTIESIASHKAGIIKEGKPVIVGNIPSEAMDVVKQVAQLKQAPFLTIGKQFSIQRSGENETYMNNEKDVQIDEIIRTLPGEHQGANMALAITAFLEVAQSLNKTVNIEKIKEGIKQARLFGRFEEIVPNVYLDGAHNPASAESLVKTIKETFPNEPIRFIVGMLKDKDVSAVLSTFEQISDEFYFVDFQNPRAMAATELVTKSSVKKKMIIEDVSAFIKSNQFSGITFITGSLYLLAQVRTSFVK